jgi:hypothetical protein
VYDPYTKKTEEAPKKEEVKAKSLFEGDTKKKKKKKQETDSDDSEDSEADSDDSEDEAERKRKRKQKKEKKEKKEGLKKAPIATRNLDKTESKP